MIRSRPRSRHAAAKSAGSASGLPSSLRRLHIYLSMISLAVVLFFSVTGITLNHPDWFWSAAESSREAQGEIRRAWLHARGPAVAEPPSDADRQVSKLEIVEYLRNTHAIHGAWPTFGWTRVNASSRSKGPAMPPTRSSTAKPASTD